MGISKIQAVRFASGRRWTVRPSKDHHADMCMFRKIIFFTLLISFLGCGSIGDGDGTSVISSGMLKIRVSTDNAQYAGGYSIDVSSDDGYSNTSNIAPNDSLDFSLPVGRYEVNIYGIGQNCSSEGSETKSVALQENGSSSVEFKIVCAAGSSR